MHPHHDSEVLVQLSLLLQEREEGLVVISVYSKVSAHHRSEVLQHFA